MTWRIIILLLLVWGQTGAQTAITLSIPKKNVQQKKIAPGLIWKQLTTDTFFNSRQNLNWLEVKPGKRQFRLAFEADSLIPTSTFARRAGALAAINAGFFDMANGGSVSFLKVRGSVIDTSQARLKESQSVILKGAVVLDRQGKLRLEPPKGEQVYAADSSAFDVLYTGPLLLQDGRPEPLADSKFNQNRHPRSCACVTAKGRVILLTADGRNREAQGLSLPELDQLLIALGCVDAVNLDGGGSTTLYIKGQSDTGVVNRPSDNQTFDHYGERRVANVLLVF